MIVNQITEENVINKFTLFVYAMAFVSFISQSTSLDNYSHNVGL